MKYFKNSTGVMEDDEDTYYVVFNCSRKSTAFVNYLKSLGSCGKDRDNYRFNSGTIDMRNCPGWAQSYRNEILGYTHVYGFSLPLKIITDFIELMED